MQRYMRLMEGTIVSGRNQTGLAFPRVSQPPVAKPDSAGRFFRAGRRPRKARQWRGVIPIDEKLPVNNDSVARTSPSLLARVRQDATDQLAWREFVRRYGTLIYQWCCRWKLRAGS